MSTVKEVATVFADALEERANRSSTITDADDILLEVAAALRDVAGAQGEEPCEDECPLPELIGMVSFGVPCPSCGHLTARAIANGHGWQFQCDRCWMRGKHERSQKEAESAWLKIAGKATDLIKERDAARAEAERAVAERNAALTTIDNLSQRIEALTKERDNARTEENLLRADLAALRAEPTQEQAAEAYLSVHVLRASGNADRREARAWLAAWRKVLGGENASANSTLNGGQHESR